MAYGSPADRVPPPDKLGPGAADPVEPDEDDAEVDKSLKVAQAEDIISAFKANDPSALCEALDAYFGK
jgi:hypothetical protein